MIKSRIVFILGAGASKPFGLPTGQELRSNICASLRDPRSPANQMLAATGFDAPTLSLFADIFERSGLSIDQFLALRPSAAPLGTRAIVACLAVYQVEQRLYVANSAPGTSDWYQYLWKLMVDDAFTPKEFLDGNHVKFITFNYDVSWERFLWNAFQSVYSVSEAEATQMVRAMGIYHVYGSMAPEVNPVFYESHLGPAELSGLAEALRVMPHQRPDADPVCFDAIVKAQKVFFLGFGYDKMNCERLGVVEARAAAGPNPPDIIGTAYRMETEENNLARRILGEGRIGNVRLVPLDCMTLLRAHVSDLV